jgi:ribosomal-protein-alanine N-acetyltransferase
MRDELQLHHAEAHTQLDNLASQAVLRRNGFSAFGVAPAHIYIDGAWRDDLLWQRALREGPPQQCPS